MFPPRKTLSLDEFEALSADYDAVAATAPDVDGFCSSSTWVLSAHHAFGGERPVWIQRFAAGFVVFALGVVPGFGVVLEPLESVWGLACPFVGRDIAALLDAYLGACRSIGIGVPRMLVGGVREGSPSARALRRWLDRQALLLRLPSTQVTRACLEGGMEGFLGRRSRKFRANLRRASRAAGRLGIAFQRVPPFRTLSEALATYRRVLQVELRSHKGRVGSGLMDAGMAAFYRRMLEHAWDLEDWRFLFARHQDRDVGFLFGVVKGDAFRGLQASFDARYADVSLGSLLHLRTIELLCQEGVRWYDMGVSAPYKERWGESTVSYLEWVVS